jgi:transketolase
MAAISNGLALHGGLIPYCATFLTFSDYARNALRMAALMKQRVVFVFTHDSIGLGEDGPTHQPVEHAASLRLIPNMDVWRPCDTVESAAAWAPRSSAATARPACCFTRQNVPHQSRSEAQLELQSGAAPTCCRTPPAPARGAHRHRLGGAAGDGGAAGSAGCGGIAVRVVSMPSTTVFDRQDARTAKPCCRAACRASPSRPASPTTGASTSASKAP